MSKVILSDIFDSSSGFAAFPSRVPSSILEECREKIVNQINLESNLGWGCKFLHRAQPKLAHLIISKFRIRDFSLSLAPGTPKIAQITVDQKPPGREGHTVHCDNEYLGSRDIKSLAICVALDPVGVENGGIEFIDGVKHKQAYSCDNLSNRFTCVDMNQGDFLVWGGNTVHRSSQNTSGRNRLVVIFHLVYGGFELVDDFYNPLFDILDIGTE